MDNYQYSRKENIKFKEKIHLALQFKCEKNSRMLEIKILEIFLSKINKHSSNVEHKQRSFCMLIINVIYRNSLILMTHIKKKILQRFHIQT